MNKQDHGISVHTVIACLRGLCRMKSSAFLNNLCAENACNFLIQVYLKVDQCLATIELSRALSLFKSFYGRELLRSAPKWTGWSVCESKEC